MFERIQRWWQRKQCRKCKLSAICLTMARLEMGKKLRRGDLPRSKARLHCPAEIEHNRHLATERHFAAMQERMEGMHTKIEKDLHKIDKYVDGVTQQVDELTDDMIQKYGAYTYYKETKVKWKK